MLPVVEIHTRYLSNHAGYLTGINQVFKSENFKKVNCYANSTMLTVTRAPIKRFNYSCNKNLIPVETSRRNGMNVVNL